MFLVFEEIDSLNDLSMSTLDDLISQLLWQIIEQFVLLSKRICRILVVLQMSLDLGKHCQRHLVTNFEFFQDSKLVIELLTVSVEIGDQISDVTNGIGVESDSHDHPQDGEDAFTD